MVAERLSQALIFSVKAEKIESVLPEIRRDHVCTTPNLDQNGAWLWELSDSVYLAKQRVKTNPAKVIRESSVKLLDCYYPLECWLGISMDGTHSTAGNLQLPRGDVCWRHHGFHHLHWHFEAWWVSARADQFILRRICAANILEALLVVAQARDEVQTWRVCAWAGEPALDVWWTI